MKLWLARHARPLVEAGTCYGASEVPVDADHTRAAAAALAAALPAGVALRSSPRRRCLDLALALCELRPDLRCERDARLAEMDFGDWEGRSWDAIGRPALDAWTARFASHRCGGGESAGELLARVAAALLAACEAGEDVLWVTHAGVARAVRLLLAPAPVPLAAASWPRDGLGFGAFDCIALECSAVLPRLRENAHAGARP